MNDYAFPHNPSEVNANTSGMTLRDYFAAKAMQAQITALVHQYHHEGTQYVNHVDPKQIAELSMRYADAMLKAREA